MRDNKNAGRPVRLQWALLAAGVAAFMQLYAVQGLLPELARDLGIAPSESALMVSAATTGLAASVLPWSFLADRVGRLRAMQCSLISAIVLSALVAAAPNLEMVLLTRFLTGAALGAVPALGVAFAYERLGRGAAAAVAAAYVAGTSLGGAAGRLIAGPLAPLLGWRLSLLLIAAVGAAAAVVFLSVTRRLPEKRTDAAAMPWRSRLHCALSVPGLRPLYMQALLLVGAYIAVYNYLAFRLEAAPYSLTPAVASLIFIAYAAGTAASRSAHRLAERLGAAATLRAGQMSFLVGLLIMLAEPLWAVIAGLLIATGGFFLAHATASAMVAERSPAGLRSQAGAFYNIAFYAGSAVGGWALGLPYQLGGWPWFTLAAAVLAAAALMVSFIRRPASPGV